MQQISRGKFDRLPRTTAGFTTSAFDGYGLRDHLPARPAPYASIRFLSIGSHVCSTLLSDLASRRRPCASLSLHLHQVVKRTFTSKLSNMLGTQGNGRQPPRCRPFYFSASEITYLCPRRHVSHRHRRRGIHHHRYGSCRHQKTRHGNPPEEEPPRNPPPDEPPRTPLPELPPRKLFLQTSHRESHLLRSRRGS